MAGVASDMKTSLRYCLMVPGANCFVLGGKLKIFHDAYGDFSKMVILHHQAHPLPPDSLSVGSGIA